MCRFNEAELNCVRTKIFFSPEFRQLLMGTSISRYLPPRGTAGFDRSCVRGKRRFPAPPARIIESTCVGYSLLFLTIWFTSRHKPDFSHDTLSRKHASVAARHLCSP